MSRNRSPRGRDSGTTSGGRIGSARNPYIYISGVFAAAWVIAAWLRPEADYVAFPFLVAASFPVSYRLALGPVAPTLAAAAAAGGAINVIVVALLLEVAGILGGPDVLPALGAVGQTTAIGIVGAVAGGAIASVGASRHG